MNHEPSLRSMLLNRLLQFGGVSSDNLLNLLAVLENHKRRHSTNAVFLSDFREIIDIDFQETCVGILFREFNDLGGNCLIN